MFIYLPEYLFLKLLKNANMYRIIVGVVLSEHGKKCDIKIFCHCHTQSVISVNETVETECCITVKYVLHDFSLY